MNTGRVEGDRLAAARYGPAARRTRVLSIYEGFFAGGARALHSTVVRELHTAGGQIHSVLSIFREMRRDSLLQPMANDARYRALRDVGVSVDSLGRAADGTNATTFSDWEVAAAARHASRADIVLSLKEQPLHLINQAGFPRRPLVVVLHRSDPENQGSALTELKTAVDAGRVSAVVCCAEATRVAYQATGIPAQLMRVIPNGVDLARFQPVPPKTRRQYRRALGVPRAGKLVVFAARHASMKNVPLFLAAAYDFLHRRPGGYVIMCGAGMSRMNADLCDEIARAFGDRPELLRRLRLLGCRDDMPAIYAAADVVALTSSNGEAAPLCLIEGMMCGAIPVATDIGDCASIVDGQGIIVEPCPTDISAAWDEAIARRAEWMPTIMRSRARFSHTRMAAAYAAVIGRAVGTPTPISPSGLINFAP
jgi:glycosyltransferase involved in cell wall biosynthesis